MGIPHPVSKHSRDHTAGDHNGGGVEIYIVGTIRLFGYIFDYYKKRTGNLKNGGGTNGGVFAL